MPKEGLFWAEVMEREWLWRRRRSWTYQLVYGGVAADILVEAARRGVVVDGIDAGVDDGEVVRHEAHVKRYGDLLRVSALLCPGRATPARVLRAR